MKGHNTFLASSFSKAIPKKASRTSVTSSTISSTRAFSSGVFPYNSRKKNYEVDKYVKFRSKSGPGEAQSDLNNQCICGFKNFMTLICSHLPVFLYLGENVGVLPARPQIIHIVSVYY